MREVSFVLFVLHYMSAQIKCCFLRLSGVRSAAPAGRECSGGEGEVFGEGLPVSAASSDRLLSPSYTKCHAGLTQVLKALFAVL